MRGAILGRHSCAAEASSMTEVMDDSTVAARARRTVLKPSAAAMCEK